MYDRLRGREEIYQKEEKKTRKSNLEECLILSSHCVQLPVGLLLFLLQPCAVLLLLTQLFVGVLQLIR